MQIKNFFLVTLFMSNLACANIGPAGFGAFLNPYFVETGTYAGSGIAKALAAGFAHVLSVEYDAHLFSNAQRRFKNDARVQLWRGDSSKDLWRMIQDINEPITFWLDAHIFPPLPNGGKNCPLIEELEQIKRHHIKTHTILIDDMHCAGTQSFDYLTKEDLVREILKINPRYTITYVDGGDAGEYKDNVMVATVH